MASIDRRRTKSGENRWEVRYRTPDGTERSKTFRTRKDAERHASTVEADKLRGAWVDPRQAGRTFADVADEWLKSNPNKRSSAWARDESIVRVHLKPAFGESPIGSLTTANLRARVAEWSESMKPRSVRRVYGTVRAIFAYAVASEILVSSPCRRIKMPEVVPVTRPVITSEQLAALSDALGEGYEVLPYLGAVLGLRWGECAGLSVCSLDLLGRTLSVTQQATRGEKGATVFGPPKSAAGRRTLAIPGQLAEMLSLHLAQRGLTAADGDALVFTMRDGGVLDYRNFRYRVWLPATKRAGVEGLTFHDLRRANASGLVMAGVDLKTAQTRLGHSDPRLTLGVYAQATSEADRAAAEALEGRFFDLSRDGRGIATA